MTEKVQCRWNGVSCPLRENNGRKTCKKWSYARLPQYCQFMSHTFSGRMILMPVAMTTLIFFYLVAGEFLSRIFGVLAVLSVSRASPFSENLRTC